MDGKDFNDFLASTGLSVEQDKTCALKQFMQSIDFVKQNKEFALVDLQRYLQCGFGTACKVVNALCVLWVVEKRETTPVSYVSLILEN